MSDIHFELLNNPRGENGEMGPLKCDVCSKKSTYYLDIIDELSFEESILWICKSCLTKGIKFIDESITDDIKSVSKGQEIDEDMKVEYDFSNGKRGAISPKIKIIKNMAKCGLCDDIIESTFRHDFVECKCGAIFVDGGKDYLRRGGDFKNIIEMSVSVSK